MVLIITIICITITLITSNPRIKTFNLKIQYRNIQINTEAQYETPKEKAVDVEDNQQLFQIPK